MSISIAYLCLIAEITISITTAIKRVLIIKVSGLLKEDNIPDVELAICVVKFDGNSIIFLKLMDIIRLAKE